MVDVELKDGDVIEASTIPCILPETVLDYLITKCELRINEADCKRFWTHMESVGDEQALKSKAWRDSLDRQPWPMGMHGDDTHLNINAAPMEKIIGIFLNLPLFRPRSTRMSRFLLFSVEQTRVVDVHRSVNPVLEKIVESMNKCTATGLGGVHFILTELRGDQSWFRFLFQTASNWKAVQVCFRCQATTRPTPLNYAIYDGWEGTQKSTWDFLIHELPNDMSPSTITQKTCWRLWGVSVLFF